jgi:2-dehydro-3-deoxygluconokinase
VRRDLGRSQRVVTFGEAMIRLSPPSDSTLEKADELRIETAGAEANVAVALARLGYDAAWVSRLPRNALGRRIVGQLREHSVDTSRVIWTDDGRVGLYFVDVGGPPRPPYVIYDRAGSALAQIQPDEVNPAVLEGEDLLHVTGITPALSSGARSTVIELVHAAASRHVAVSYDLNYRAKLWSPQEALAFSEEILPMVVLFFLTSGDAATVFHIDGPPEEQLLCLTERYPGITIVLSAGEQGAWAWDGEMHHQPIVPSAEVDRIGRGDALVAGFIVGRHERDAAYGLACGTALAALAQTYAGDFVWATREDLLALVDGIRPSHFR